ncbi:MAG TPA: PEP-CTERM sorting domain-containing protein [Terriglobales bacterium]|nr:PEP-CTERM sorting domain-containing protein [Terriglobales bacterium]
MKQKLLLLLATVVLAGAQFAHADNLQITLCESGNACVSTTGTGLVQFNSAYGDFTVNVVTGTGSPNLPSGELDLSSVNVTGAWTGGGDKTLQIWVSEVNNSLGSGGTQSWSNIATGQLVGTGTNVVYSAYQDNSNTFNGTANVLYTNSQSGGGPFSFSGTGSASVGGSYSLTEELVVTLGSGGQLSSGDATLVPNTSVPEPSSTMLLVTGLLGISSKVWRRKR